MDTEHKFHIELHHRAMDALESLPAEEQVAVHQAIARLEASGPQGLPPSQLQKLAGTEDIFILRAPFNIRIILQWNGGPHCEILDIVRYERIKEMYG